MSTWWVWFAGIVGLAALVGACWHARSRPQWDDLADECWTVLSVRVGEVELLTGPVPSTLLRSSVPWMAVAASGQPIVVRARLDDDREPSRLVGSLVGHGINGGGSMFAAGFISSSECLPGQEVEAQCSFPTTVRLEGMHIKRVAKVASRRRWWRRVWQRRG